MESGKLKMKIGRPPIIHYSLQLRSPHKKTGSPERLPVFINRTPAPKAGMNAATNQEGAQSAPKSRQKGRSSGSSAGAAGAEDAAGREAAAAPMPAPAPYPAEPAAP